MAQSDPSTDPRHALRRPTLAVTAAVLAVALALPAATASAKPTPQQQIKTLQAEVAKLKKQLKAANTELARLKAQTAPTTVPAGCTQPCADAKGFTAAVTNYHFDTQSGNEFEQPETGNVFVQLDITLTNGTKSSKTVDVVDFKLTDGTGVSRLTTSISDCESWSYAELAPGATFGPKCLAFQAAASKPTGLVLQWKPSFLGSTYKIPLG